MRSSSLAIGVVGLVAASVVSAVSLAGDVRSPSDGEPAGAQKLASVEEHSEPAVLERKPRGRQYHLAVDDEHLVLITDRDEEVLRFPARLDVQAGAVNRSLGGRWEQRGPDRAVGRASNALVDVVFEVHADPTTAFIEANVEVTYKRNTSVAHEVWTLPLVDVHGRVLDRSYAWREVDDKPLVVDQWTPLIGQFHTDDGPAFGLLGDDTFQAARVERHALHLELDHWANHPHTVYAACHDTYAPHRPEVGQSRQQRAAGQKVTASIRLVAGRGRMPVLRRWPDDKQAAFAFVDHADNGRASTLRALLHGSSRPDGIAVDDSDAADAPRGLLGHGLVMTRTAFDHKRQLGDQTFTALLHELTAAGGEVAPHSITPWRESKRTVADALATSFKPWAPKSWVDHQPDTNCEAINNLGGRRNHKGNIVQTLLDGGIRYVWEAPDPDYDGNLNLLIPKRTMGRSPFFYRAPRIGRGVQTEDPWLFTTAWMFLPVDQFVSRLTDERLAALEGEHGIHLGHTYLGAVHRSPEHADNTIFVRDKRGKLTTRPEVEAAWARLAAHQKAGKLWVTTVASVGDWLSTWDGIRLQALSPTRVKVTHTRQGTGHGERLVEQGFTLAARYKGKVNGQRRVTLAIDEEAHVWPPIYEDDVGVTLLPGAALPPRTALGRGYAWPRGTASLFAVARDLDAPGTRLDEPCVQAMPGGDCVKTALAPFYDRLDGLVALGEQQPERTRVLVFGNSLIASDRVTDIVRQRLQARFGDGGRGIVYVDALKYFGRRAWTGQASDGWYPEYLTQYMGERPPAAYPLGVTGGHFVAFKPGASTTWPTGGARQAELLWLDHPKAPAFTLSTERQTLIRVEPEHTGKAALTAIDLPYGTRELTFTTEGARAVVYGATLEQPKPGVVLDTIGIVAASANSYLKADASVFTDQLQMRDPTLIVFMLGGNEARRIDRGVFTKRQVHDDFIKFVKRARKAAPDAACLTVGPIETVFVDTPRNKPFQTRPYVDYVVQTERALSLELGCGFIDLFAAMGGKGSLTKFDRKGYLHGDRIHPKGDGLDMLGELVADALLRGYADSRADRRNAMASLFGEHDALLLRADPAYVIDPGDEEMSIEVGGTRRPAGERSSP